MDVLAFNVTCGWLHLGGSVSVAVIWCIIIHLDDVTDRGIGVSEDCERYHNVGPHRSEQLFTEIMQHLTHIAIVMDCNRFHNVLPLVMNFTIDRYSNTRIFVYRFGI